MGRDVARGGEDPVAVAGGRRGERGRGARHRGSDVTEVLRVAERVDDAGGVEDPEPVARGGRIEIDDRGARGHGHRREVAGVAEGEHGAGIVGHPVAGAGWGGRCGPGGGGGRLGRCRGAEVVRRRRLDRVGRARVEVLEGDDSG